MLGVLQLGAGSPRFDHTRVMVGISRLKIARGAIVSRHRRRRHDIQPDAKLTVASGPLHRVRGLFLRRKINLDPYSVRIRKHYPPVLGGRLTKIIYNVVIPELIEQSPKTYC